MALDRARLSHGVSVSDLEGYGDEVRANLGGIFELPSEAQSEGDPEKKPSKPAIKFHEEVEEVEWRPTWASFTYHRNATGCRYEYFVKHPDSIRIHFPEMEKRLESHFDPISRMKTGMMVLAYNQEPEGYIRMHLRVDNQLRFFYATVHQTATKSIGKDEPAKMATVPMEHICKVYTMTDAMHICEANSIPLLRGIDIESLVVFRVDPSFHSEHDVPPLDENMPTLENLWLFITTPDQRLFESIHACTDFAAGKVEEPADDGLRLDDLMIKQGDDVFNIDTHEITVDASFRVEGSMRRESVRADGNLEEILGEFQLRLNKYLLPVDTARACFTLEDAIVSRNHISLVGHNSLFKKGICNFVRDTKNLDKVMEDHEIVQLGETSADAADRLRRMEGAMAEHSDDVGEGGRPVFGCCPHYGEASSRAVLAGVVAMLAIERESSNVGGAAAAGLGASVRRRTKRKVSADAEDNASSSATDDAAAVQDLFAEDEPILSVRLGGGRCRCGECGFVGDETEPMCMVCETPRALAQGGSAPVHAAPAGAKTQAAAGDQESPYMDEMLTARGNDQSTPGPSQPAAASNHSHNQESNALRDTATNGHAGSDMPAAPEASDSKKPEVSRKVDPEWEWAKDDPRFQFGPPPEDKRGGDNVLACMGACGTPRTTQANNEKAPCCVQ